jgi:hypothetical protein
MHVQRQQRRNPSAKLDEDIIKRTARCFRVTERTVWRALKFHTSMVGTRDPYVGEPDAFLKSIHDYCETAILPHLITDEEIIKEVAPYYGMTEQDMLDLKSASRDPRLFSAFLQALYSSYLQPPAQPEPKGMEGLRAMQEFHDGFIEMTKELAKELPKKLPSYYVPLHPSLHN